MEKIKIGIIREGKVPPDHRVPLTPKQCKSIQVMYPNVEVVVQPSPIRAFKDNEYISEGLRLCEDLSECDVILGVKEVKIHDLIPGKKFMFFSHTIKKQPYNRDLLNAILDKKIELIDYEVIKDKHNKRLIGFGRYAGIVGCYNAFLTFGLKHELYELKPAHQCADRKEMEAELAFKINHSNTFVTVMLKSGEKKIVYAYEKICGKKIDLMNKEYLKGLLEEGIEIVENIYSLQF